MHRRFHTQRFHKKEYMLENFYARNVLKNPLNDISICSFMKAFCSFPQSRLSLAVNFLEGLNQNFNKIGGIFHRQYKTADHFFPRVAKKCTEELRIL